MNGRGVYSLPVPDRDRLIRGVQHLHALGPRVIAEFLVEVADNAPDLLRRLDDYGRLTPETGEKLGVSQWTRPIRAMLRRAA